MKELPRPIHILAHQRPRPPPARKPRTTQSFKPITNKTTKEHNYMGMDLIPKNKIKPLHMNFTAWGILKAFLECAEWKGTLAELNDGDKLPAKECQTIAELIEQNIDTMLFVQEKYYEAWDIKDDESTPDKERQYWLKISEFFKNCNGCEQW